MSFLKKWTNGPDWMLVAGALTMMLVLVSVASGEDYTQWSDSAAVLLNTTAGGADVSGNVEEFPVLVRLDNGNFDFSEAEGNGEDIRFAKYTDGTHMPYQIEKWDSAGAQAAIWVLVDTVYGNDSTELRMYWGKSDAADSSDGEAVFAGSNGFASVWHLDEEQSGTGNSDLYKDATGNSYDGDDYVSATGQDGMIGKGHELDGTDDYIDVPDFPDAMPESVTVSAWVKLDNQSAHRPIVAKTNQYFQPGFALVREWDDRFKFYTTVDFTKRHVETSADFLTDDGTVWYYVAGTYDKSTLRLYVDGSQEGSASYAGDMKPDPSEELAIGRDPYTADDEIDGVVDEVRVSTVARSAEWIELCYENQKAAQTLVGISELDAGGEDYALWAYRKPITLNTSSSGADVSGDVTDFPVLVRLDSENFNFCDAQSSGQDIRFAKADDSTHLAYQIERWDADEDVAEIWVLVDTVYGGDSAQYINMYWGNPGVGDRSSGDGVFSTTNGFAGVWHLDEERAGVGTADVYKDATSNGINGKDSISSSDRGGVVGRGHFFELDTDDHIQLGNPSALNFGTGDIMISLWASTGQDAGAEWPELFSSKPDDASTEGGYELLMSSSSWKPDTLFFKVYEPNGNDVVAANKINDSTWHHVVARKTETELSVYVDGQEIASKTHGLTGSTDNGNAVTIGAPDAWDWGRYDGYLDEVRAESVARCADWIKLSYQNQKLDQSLVEMEPYVEDYSEWPYSQRIYFNTDTAGAAIDSPITDFPCLVRLDAENFSFYQASSDGADLRFTDPDGTRLPHEVDSWDVGEQRGAVWVRVPRIEGSSARDYINMHYGRFGVCSKERPEEVWDSTYAAVYHLQETPLGDSSGVMLDASRNANHATPHSSMTAADRDDGSVGSAVCLDGSDDVISASDDAGLDLTQAMSISAWIRLKTTSPDYYGIVGKKEGSNDNAYSFFIKDNGSDLELAARLDAANTTLTSTVNAPIVAGNWHHVGMTFDNAGDSVVFYFDGEKLGNTITTATMTPTVQSNKLRIGTEGADDFFNGRIDEVRISNVVRQADWFRYCYENQRLDGALQLTNRNGLTPSFDGTLSNEPGDGGFAGDTTILKVKHGVEPASDTIDYALLQFDVAESGYLPNLGWTLENADLRLGIEDIETPTEYGFLRFGVYSGDRFLPTDRQDGYRSWREDQSTFGSGSSIQMDNGTTYEYGIGGQPDSSGDWGWMLYDVRSEMTRLGIPGMPDSISGRIGHHDSSTSIDVYIKSSTLDTAPTLDAWKTSGTGVSTVASATWSSNADVGETLNGVNWLWLGMKSGSADTTDHGVFADIKLWADIPKPTEMVLFQVQSDGLDTADMDWVYRDNGVKWRHAAFEEDAAGDGSSEGIGTEDLMQEGYWNRYKGRYRMRSPLAAVTIDGRQYGRSDTTVYYFGVTGDGRVLPHGITQGYYDFVEDLSTKDGESITIDSTVYPVGIGGSPPDGSGNYASMVFDLESERERLEFGEILSITGIAGEQDGTGSVDVYVKTSTSSTEPSQSDWENTSGGVVQQVHKSSSQSKVEFEVTGASDINWVWIGCKTGSGDGSGDYGVWADMRLNAATRGEQALVISTPKLGKGVASALDNAASGEGNDRVTLLAALYDSGTVTLHSSRATQSAVRPRLELTFSDSRTLLSWGGRDSSLTIPQSTSVTLAGDPSLGDGRYGRVLRYHEAGEKAAVFDSGRIDYSQGMIEFWYQKTGSGNAEDAVFFRRQSADSTYFELARDGTDDGLYFLYGDTTDTNMMQWSFVDSFITEIDTVNDDTTWAVDTSVNPFDGAQHYLQFTWNYFSGAFALTIDGVSPYVEGTVVATTNPASWYHDSLSLGEGVDGYLEEFIVRSKASVPEGILMPRVVIDTITSYLPYIQSGFNDTVECIVISPADELMREELEKYALRNISMGIRSKVVSLEDIRKYYAGADTEERIRNFLKYAYTKWHPTYLVIGASTDLIPTRTVAFETQQGHAVTTDRYYACLEGTWNADGDGYYAEEEDNVDLTAELVVGRFPAMRWQELRMMIEKSTMALALPPYEDQCIENFGSMMLTGVRMFSNIGDVSDGTYYSSILQEIVDSGAYTDGSMDTRMREYYPSDDTTRALSADSMRKLFVDTLTPGPNLWVHFGHGHPHALLIDQAGSGTDELRQASLTLKAIGDNQTVFNRFKRMLHVRVVGCATAAQDELSIARRLLTKKIGGAVSYVGAGEHSYPVVEARLLQREMEALADSSLFTWGEIHTWAADKMLETQGTWDIAKWVTLSRNYLGDPVLPVRYDSLTAVDTLNDNAPSFVVDREGILTITVKDKNGDPVEGARLGLVQQRLVYGEGDSVYYKPVEDITFAGAVTNRKGKAALDYRVQRREDLLLTSTHHDFLPERTPIPVNPQVVQRPAVAYKIFDDSDDEQMDRNNVFEPAETLGVAIKFTNDMYSDSDDSLYNFDVRLEHESYDTSAFAISWWDTISEMAPTLDTGQSAFYRERFILDSCPSGATDLRLRVWYSFDVNGQTTQQETLWVTLPVTSAEIVPVITYLFNGDAGDTAYTPEAGDTVRMNILLGNRYPAKALGVQCSLSIVDGGSAGELQRTGGTVNVGPLSATQDDSIRYYIKTGYDEETQGIIRAKLHITGTNIRTQVREIDLNPPRNIALSLDTGGTELDYAGGVRLSWEPVRVQEGHGLWSDYRGVVVTRRKKEADDSTTALLTLSPVAAANYFRDNIPTDTAADYLYTVMVVDSSYNYSREDSVVVHSPAKLRKNFPIFSDNVYSWALQTADYDKDGMGEMMASIWTTIGYRADGQGAVEGNARMATDNVLPSRGPGSGTDAAAVDGFAFADMDGDGYDEGIFVRPDTVDVVDYQGTVADRWLNLAAVGGHEDRVVMQRGPIVADVDADGGHDIILFGMDESRTASPSATSVYIIPNTGTETDVIRHDFRHWSLAPGVAVGDFESDQQRELEICVGAMSNDPGASTDWEKSKWHLYLLDDIDFSTTTTVVSDSVYLCNVAGPKDTAVVDCTQGMMVNSALSVGNIYGGLDTLEAVFGIGKTNKSASDVKDTLVVYGIVRATGQFAGDGPLAYYPVEFENPAFWGASPALGDLDGDGTDDIAFATENNLYLLKMTSDTGGLLTPLPPLDSTRTCLALGSKPDNRLFDDEPTPQPLIADIDDDDNNEVVVNHYGDGNIWAFNVDTSDNPLSVCAGFPLRTKGKVEQPCYIADLENDGVLDLVALDKAGYIYSFALDTGTVYGQPWASRFGNGWHTGCNLYRDLGGSGFLYERWDKQRAKPYEWVETETNNALTGPQAPQFEQEGTALKTDATGDRNVHFYGPNVGNWTEYTVRGTFKFDSANAEFGVNFYSQWGGVSSKLTLMREPSGYVNLYYYSDATTREQIGSVEYLSGPTVAPDTDTWYSYRITMSNGDADSNFLQVNIWERDDPDGEPEDPGLKDSIAGALDEGTIGFVAHDGDGYKYWGPVEVTSSVALQGTRITYQDFSEFDSVDVKPYVPYDWHPDYRFQYFPTDQDTSGFVFRDSADSKLDLVYRHKEGVSYPAKCRLMPPTHLEWRDYVFEGTVKKPVGDVYDTVGVNIVVYEDSAGNAYRVKFKHTGVYLSGGRWTTDTLLSSDVFGGGDELEFSVKGLTLNDGETVDGKVRVIVDAQVPGQWSLIVVTLEDTGTSRLVDGYVGVEVDMSTATDLHERATEGVRFDHVGLQKTYSLE